MNNKYRLKWWYLLLSIFIGLVTLSILVSILAFILLGTGILLIGFSFNDWQAQSWVPLGMICIIPSLFAGFLILIGIIMPLGNSLFSYLRIGSTGLELRSWPSYRLRCDWSQIIGVEQVRIFAGYSVAMLRIKEGEVESWPGFLGRPGPYFISMNSMDGVNMYLPWLIPLVILFLLWPDKHQNLIPVYLFKGWPNGKLRQDLESKLGSIPFDR